MRSFLAAIAVTLLPFAPSNAHDIDTIVTAAMRDSGTPGASIAIAEPNRPVYLKGFGTSPAGEITSSSIFEMGSLTKQFVATAVMQLVEAGKIDLDAPIGRYVPEFSQQAGLTVRNLLHQSSGLTEFNTRQFDQRSISVRSNGAVDRTRLLTVLAHEPLRFAPGSKFEYCNTNYLVLGTAIENTTHASLERYMREHLFQPAGMTQTTVSPVMETGPHGFATLFGFAEPMPDWSMAWIGGAGALRTTPGDLMRWEDALFSKRLVSQRSLSLMTTPYKDRYGFGLVIDRGPHATAIWHNGGMSNTHSMLLHYVPMDLNIAVVGNTPTFPAERVALLIARELAPELNAHGYIPGEPHTRRDGLFGLAGVLCPLLTLLITRRGWWRWAIAPLAAAAVLAAGIVVPVYAGVAGIMISLLMLLPHFIRRRTIAT